MLPEDLAELESAFEARGDIAFLAVRMASSAPREEATLGPLPLDLGGRYLARRVDLDKLCIDHVPQQGDYVIAAARSPVVEFSRSRLDGDAGRLAPGRMWFATRTWDGTAWIEPASLYGSFQTLVCLSRTGEFRAVGKKRQKSLREMG